MNLAVRLLRQNFSNYAIAIPSPPRHCGRGLRVEPAMTGGEGYCTDRKFSSNGNVILTTVF